MKHDTRKQGLLVIDTAYNGFIVGLRDPSGKEYVSENSVLREQASELIASIDALCKRASMRPHDIGCIGVTRGPGSYTGLRLGLAAVKALHLALNMPVIGYTCFDVLNHQIQTQDKPLKPYAILIETKRQDFYAAFYDEQGQSLFAPASMDADALESQIVETGVKTIYGNAVTQAQQYLNSAIEAVDIQKLSPAVFLDLLSRAESEKSEEVLVPLYLKAADISVSKKKQILLK